MLRKWRVFFPEDLFLLWTTEKEDRGCVAIMRDTGVDREGLSSLGDLVVQEVLDGLEVREVL